ncbi:MAG TPA: hypothetical protein VFN16_10615, partial [Saccharospirillum sp.]|nr:hypothetical protein [Saccharospirillum sp.]
VMGSRDKPLYDLVLSLNQQWVRVQSERAFPPGTVLMVEATPENQLRVLPQVDTAQLNRMMQASLQFWQAHSLPRAHTTQMPAPPAFPALQALAGDAPELQALVQWLSQKPALSAQTVAQWMQVFSPLARLQPPVTNLSATPLIPSAAQPATNNTAAQPAPSASPAGNIASPISTAPLTPLLQAIASLNSAGPALPGNAAGSAPTLAGAGATAVLIPLPAGAPALPAGTALVFQTTATERAPLAQSTVATSQRTPAEQSQTAPASLRVAVVLIPQTQAPLQSAMATLQTATAGSAPQVRPAQTVTSGQISNPTATPSQPGAITGNLNPTATPQDPLLAPSRFITLPPPPGTAAPAGSDPMQTIPVEVRLSQWLAVLDSRIQQHPASLQQALAQQAQRMLNTPAPGYAPGVTVQNQGGGTPIKQDDLQPLLQLRTLLESLQGKTQNNAVQQALGALANPDAPPVQQLSIPLLWLGPNHWLNMEWWQEKPEAEDTGEDTPGKRPFRFRLFFELPPLAPLCADLHWTPEHTDVIFWSQDQGTLSIINSHLDTLEQWTQGLGERALQTRHGMPPKKTTPEPDQFKPLVDVRT